MRRRTDAFELWCWRRLLRVPWTARRSNQSILKEISPEYSLEGLMLKLKLQYFATWCEELTRWKRPRCWERLKVGEEGDDRGWDGWMASPTQQIWVWVNSGSWWRTGWPGMLQSTGLQRVGHDWMTELNLAQCTAMCFLSVDSDNRVCSCYTKSSLSSKLIFVTKVSPGKPHCFNKNINCVYTSSVILDRKFYRLYTTSQIPK